jgi:hypothetical protein
MEPSGCLPVPAIVASWQKQPQETSSTRLGQPGLGSRVLAQNSLNMRDGITSFEARYDLRRLAARPGCGG